jgi:CheY-like chemotaxis protein
MGGGIQAESTPGQGSVFRFSVVGKPVEASPSRPHQQTGRHRPTPISQPQDIPLNVLVAEDNPVNQIVAQMMLKRLGHQADLAGDGIAAVEAAEHRIYDVVLMDVQMPGLDGFEACRRIRHKLGSTTQPHIIGLTAHATQEDRKKCLEAGMNDFLTKPVQLEELRAAFERAKSTVSTQSRF